MMHIIKDQLRFTRKFDNTKSKILSLANTMFFTILVGHLGFRNLMCPIITKEKKVSISFQGINLIMRFPSADFSALNETCHKKVYDKPRKPKGVIFDIGSHIGTFALSHARKSDNKIYCFEPCPSNVKILEENIKINGNNNVVISRCAVSDYDGNSKLYIPELSSVTPSLYRSHLKNSVDVDVCKLDTFMDKQGLDALGFIKVDIEGAELEMLKGAEVSLKRYHPIIAIETTDFEDIIKLLKSFGYNSFSFGRSYSGLKEPNMIYCEVTKKDKELM